MNKTQSHTTRIKAGNSGRSDAAVAYRGGLVSYPDPWSFLVHRAHIILVSDHELEALSDPDRVLNLTLTFDRHEGSLRQVCERARAAGQRTLIIAFDHFFSQYRPGQAGPRRLTPDMDEYVQRIAAHPRWTISATRLCRSCGTW